ncbi:hypothetical protein LUZ60_007815 [Juncus effusus]|nr:hypothetical protein LUZ60_007815 [Juncus effusus]
MEAENEEEQPICTTPTSSETSTPRKSLLRSASWTAGSSPTANPKPKPDPVTIPVRPPRRPGRLALPLRPSLSGWPRQATDDSGPTTARSLADPDPADISRVTDHIYLGSDSVARDRAALHRHGITHILNCVGSACPDYFRSDSSLTYKTLWLHDSPGEDLASILYDAFDFLESALIAPPNGGRALVHCMKGASRSAAVVVAYLMWRNSLPFDAALRRVRAARPAADPNLGFAAQLLRRQQRVNGSPASPGSIRRILRLAPHSPYAPQHLVPKTVPVLTSGVGFLDSRGAFLVHVPGGIYVWIGKKCEPVMALAAAKAARQVIKYERVSGPIVSVNEGDEDADFWGAVSEEMIVPNPLEVGKRRVEDYDLDFEIFYHSLKSGSISSSSSNNNNNIESPESCTPSSSSSSAESAESNFSPVSCSSSDWYNNSPSTPERNQFYQTPRVVLDPIKENEKDLIIPSNIVKPKKGSLAERRGGFAPCLSLSEKDESERMDWCPSPAFIPDLDEEHELNIKRQLSLSTSEELEKGKESEFVHPVLYKWPEMEKIEEIHHGVLDSFSIFLMVAMDSRVGSKRSKTKVLYVWLGYFAKLGEIEGSKEEGEDERDVYAMKIGEEFVDKMGLPKNTSFKVIKEGHEPEEFLNHLFSFR